MLTANVLEGRMDACGQVWPAIFLHQMSVSGVSHPPTEVSVDPKRVTAGLNGIFPKECRLRQPPNVTWVDIAGPVEPYDVLGP